MGETKERVKVRSAASTEVAAGSGELGDQIARLNGCFNQGRARQSPC